MRDHDTAETQDELPLDFVAFLQRRLGTQRRTAEARLERWLVEYVPEKAHPIHFLKSG